MAKQEAALKRTMKRSTPSSSCDLQGATVRLLHDHLHVVEDEVVSHAPNRLHRLLHESAEGQTGVS